MDYNYGEFVPNKCIIENLNKLSERLSLLEERRICEIADIAGAATARFSEMISDDYDIYEIISVFSELFSNREIKVHDFCLKENEESLISFMKRISATDKVVFSEFFYKMLLDVGIKISESDFFERANENSTVAFVKNALAAEAYDVFSQQIENPRLKYAKDMKEAVTLLLSGEAGFAVLPFEERGAQRLKAVSEIIFKEDLKINSVTPVFGPYGGANMKYALVSRYMSIPDISEGDDRYLEIRLSSKGDSPIFEIFSAAAEYKITPYRINTINFETPDGEEPYCSVVFKLDSGDFAPFLLYLTLFVADYTSVGIYKNLE